MNAADRKRLKEAIRHNNEFHKEAAERNAALMEFASAKRDGTMHKVPNAIEKDLFELLMENCAHEHEELLECRARLFAAQDLIRDIDKLCMRIH